MKTSVKFFVCAAVALFSQLALADTPTGDPSRFITDKVVVTGLVERPLTLTVADLRAFPAQQIVDVPVVRQFGNEPARTDVYRGVLLRTILEKAGIVSRDHNDVKKIALIVGASDGYKVAFSWSEIFNTAAGDTVLVFFEKNGKPLADDEGRLALISGRDTRTGPRHVKWLQSVDVRKIVD